MEIFWYRKFPVNNLKLVFVLLPLLADAAVSPVSKNISYKCSQPDTPKQLCPSAHSRDPGKYSCPGLSLPRWHSTDKHWQLHWRARTGFPVHKWVNGCPREIPPCFQEQGQVMTTGEPLMLTALSLNKLIYRIHIGKCLHRFIIPINTISQKLV